MQGIHIRQVMWYLKHTHTYCEMECHRRGRWRIIERRLSSSMALLSWRAPFEAHTLPPAQLQQSTQDYSIFPSFRTHLMPGSIWLSSSDQLKVDFLFTFCCVRTDNTNHVALVLHHRRPFGCQRIYAMHSPFVRGAATTIAVVPIIRLPMPILDSLYSPTCYVQTTAYIFLIGRRAQKSICIDLMRRRRQGFNEITVLMRSS